MAEDQIAAINTLKIRSDIDPKHIGLWELSQG